MPLSVGIEVVAAALFLVGSQLQNQLWAGTTLAAPRRWSCLAVAAVLALDLWLSWSNPEFVDRRASRYVVDSLLLTPWIALLGAKRPQDRAWQWIVLSLWCVLIVPWVQWWAFGQGQFRLHLSWQLFLLLLLATQLLNYLGTTQIVPALVWTAGQVCLLVPVLELLTLSGANTTAGPEPGAMDAATGIPGAGEPGAIEIWLRAAGLMLIGASPFLASRAAASWAHRGRSWNRVWWDFRDLYGVAWGRRVLDRINQPAQLNGWPVRLTWSGGFVAHGSTTAGEQAVDAAADRAAVRSGRASAPEHVARDTRDWSERDVDQVLRTVLRRFVSPNWLNDRLPVGPTAETAE